MNVWFDDDPAWPNLDRKANNCYGTFLTVTNSDSTYDDTVLVDVSTPRTPFLAFQDSAIVDSTTGMTTTYTDPWITYTVTITIKTPVIDTSDGTTSTEWVPYDGTAV